MYRTVMTQSEVVKNVANMTQYIQNCYFAVRLCQSADGFTLLLIIIIL